MNDPLFDVGDSVIYHTPPDGMFPIQLSYLQIKKAKNSDLCTFRIVRRAVYFATYYYELDGMPGYLVKEEFLEPANTKQKITDSDFELLLNGA